MYIAHRHGKGETTLCEFNLSLCSLRCHRHLPSFFFLFCAELKVGTEIIRRILFPVRCPQVTGKQMWNVFSAEKKEKSWKLWTKGRTGWSRVLPKKKTCRIVRASLHLLLLWPHLQLAHLAVGQFVSAQSPRFVWESTKFQSSPIDSDWHLFSLHTEGLTRANWKTAIVLWCGPAQLGGDYVEQIFIGPWKLFLGLIWSRGVKLEGGVSPNQIFFAFICSDRTLFACVTCSR